MSFTQTYAQNLIKIVKTRREGILKGCMQLTLYVTLTGFLWDNLWEDLKSKGSASAVTVYCN